MFDLSVQCAAYILHCLQAVSVKYYNEKLRLLQWKASVEALRFPSFKSSLCITSHSNSGFILWARLGVEFG